MTYGCGSAIGRESSEVLHLAVGHGVPAWAEASPSDLLDAGLDSSQCIPMDDLAWPRRKLPRRVGKDL